MDSNKIKNLAFGARDALRKEVSARIDTVLAEGSDVRLDQPDKVRMLEKAIEEKGLDEVVESSAYTWFNRLCALRFMDARGYTPVPVVTPRTGATQPAILADAAQGVFDPDFEFSRLVRDKVSSVLMGGTSGGANRTEAAYAELIIAVCDHYAEAMPYLFAETAASSLVMPSSLLSEESILRRIVEEMDDEACESVEVLGWLYQFYVAERKDEFFASSRKASPNDIAPATQLFTPRWIVRYLVENSLGRLWMLNNPHSSLATKMMYYIDSAGESENCLRVHSPEDLSLCDPACGSGHILVYAFDLLYEIYLEEGYFADDIPALILQKNLYGMEIDNRAAEIAMFSLEMKAREKDASFFDKRVDANITVLEELSLSVDERREAGLPVSAVGILDAFEHMKECGSLYAPSLNDEVLLGDASLVFRRNEGLFTQKSGETIGKMLEIAKALRRKYSCVVANPPYMGSSKFNSWTSKWMREHYPNERGDLCTCFVARARTLAVEGGYCSLVTSDPWLTKVSFEYFRTCLISGTSLRCAVHMSDSSKHADIFGANVAFSLWNHSPLDGALSCFHRLTLLGNEAKEVALLDDIQQGRHYLCDMRQFESMPDHAISYSSPRSVLAAYAELKPLDWYAKAKKGLTTSCDDAFLRLWFEVASSRSCLRGATVELSSKYRWFPCSKGGAYRKWYGNNDYVIDWLDDGCGVKNYRDDEGRVKSCVRNLDYMFRECISGNDVASKGLSFRYKPTGHLFNDVGPSVFSGKYSLNILAGILNSSAAQLLSRALTTTNKYTVGTLSKIPLPVMDGEMSEIVNAIVGDSVSISKRDWDDFETSWDFACHPLARFSYDRTEQLSCGNNARAHNASATLISERFSRWEIECNERFGKLKANEEQLNRIFMQIYSMEGEVSIEVPDEKVSVRRADLVRDIKSLVSYGVGCIFGRFSTYAPGLILADAQQTVEDFRIKVPNAQFLPDNDAIVPVLDDEWFDDDIVVQFSKWLEVTYGRETLDENIEFIESALGKDLRKYFVKDFYKDHCSTYQVTGSGKRPIYWMFVSPRGSFQVLVYMHRYTPSTVGHILTKYLREYIEKLNAAIVPLDQSGRAVDSRQADKYRTVIRELSDWERDVIYPLANERIEIDLDDGVGANYNKFPHALAKVQGLSKWK